jgi:MFS family permease
MRTSDEPSQPRANAAAILAIVLVSYFMILLDNSIIFTALPSIDSALNLSVTGLSWVQDAYTLVFGGLLLLGARAGDLLGRRRPARSALVVAAALIAAPRRPRRVPAGDPARQPRHGVPAANASAGSN